MNMLRQTTNGIIAGILISIGGSVFLACDTKWVGSILFCVALLCICVKGYALFTGKVGFMALKHGKDEWSVLLTSLLGNTIGTIVCGLAIRYAVPTSGAAAETLCSGKLANQTLPQTFIRAIFCGILMYLAVSLFKDHGTKTGIFFGIPVFIVSGFEHSIADMFYFSASGIVSAEACIYLWTVILGNAVGGLLLPMLQKITGGNPKNG